MTSSFILASSSPRRQELLKSIGVRYEIIKPEIDETQQPNELPLDYVRRLSLEKAFAVANKVNNRYAIIAADTIVILAADTIGVETSGEILGKPIDTDDARAMLQRLRGKPHLVCTAFTILVTDTPPKTITQTVCTEVYMRNYSNAEIDAYIATGDPFDKAGSYAIQHEGFHPVEKIEGSYTNVVGLPIAEVKNVLDELGLL